MLTFVYWIINSLQNNLCFSATNEAKKVIYLFTVTFPILFPRKEYRTRECPNQCYLTLALRVNRLQNYCKIVQRDIKLSYRRAYFAQVHIHLFGLQIKHLAIRSWFEVLFDRFTPSTCFACTRFRQFLSCERLFASLNFIELHLKQFASDFTVFTLTSRFLATDGYTRRLVQ